jgi:hypothetical protein
MRAHRIDQCRALTDEEPPCPMQHQKRLLFRCLDLDKAHGRSCHRLTNRCGVRRIILVPLDVGLHILGRHQLDLVTERPDLARPIMRGRAGLDPDKAGRVFLEEWQNLASPELPAYGHCSIRVDAVNLENALRNIQSDRSNLFHWAAPS